MDAPGTLVGHGRWCQSIDICNHVDNDRAFHLKGAMNGGCKITRTLDSNASRAHFLRNARKVDRTKGPQLAPSVRLLTAIRPVESRLRLVATAVVVHDDHDVDFPPCGGFELCNVVPKPGVACKDHNGPLGPGAFSTEARRERPSQVSGTPDVALEWSLHVEHATHPHARMAGVYNDDGIVWGLACQIGHKPLGTHRYGVRFQCSAVLLVPLSADLSYGVKPGLALFGHVRIGVLEQTLKNRPCVAKDRGLERIVAANRLRINVDLNRGHTYLRSGPEIGRHPTCRGADETDEVGLRYNTIGTLARVTTDDAYRQRMSPRYRIFSV